MTVTICTWSPERPKDDSHDRVWEKKDPLSSSSRFLALVRTGAVWMARVKVCFTVGNGGLRDVTNRSRLLQRLREAGPQALHTSISE